MDHEETICIKQPNSARYSYRNWSILFVCPTCQRSGRFNMNFLGSRRVYCNGDKFLRRGKYE